MNLTKTSLAIAIAASAFGCQSAIPNELADARSAYQQAQAGPATKYDPSALYKARKSLELAELTYDNEGDSARSRDRAYVAMRQAQLATVSARIERDEQELQRMRRHRTEAQEKALEQANAKITATESQLNATESRLEEERARREQAEQLAEQARKDLAEFATVQQDNRGTIITLTGQVLFKSGESELLGPARARLAMVAQSLMTSYPDDSITVQGHTDSQGPDQLNERLSQKRAESVAAFLEEQGIASDRISAIGKGESEPVASNDTAEGRANNRRVEIVVGNGATTGAETSRSAGTTAQPRKQAPQPSKQAPQPSKQAPEASSTQAAPQPDSAQ